MRAAPFLLLLALSACGSRAQERQAAAEAAQPSGPKLQCRIDGAWSEECSLERNGDAFLVREPSGSFRRFRRAPDGALDAADGAEPLRRLGETADSVEIALGAARYRIPKRMLR